MKSLHYYIANFVSSFIELGHADFSNIDNRKTQVSKYLVNDRARLQGGQSSSSESQGLCDLSPDSGCSPWVMVPSLTHPFQPAVSSKTRAVSPNKHLTLPWKLASTIHSNTYMQFIKRLK